MDKVFRDDEDGRANLLVSILWVGGAGKIDVVRKGEREVAEARHLDHLAIEQVLADVPAECLPDLLGRRTLLVCLDLVHDLLATLHL